MIERIENEILDVKPNIHFEDIAGLEDVKRTLNEMIIQPNKRPDLFKGLRAPPKGLLLFGPPGNGKTLIAKAVATEAGLTFFAISASSLTSKWIGEGEKMVKALFAVARSKQPAFIFIDEIDAILCSRSIEEHESSRRLKNEFLTQFEGATTSAEDRITVMGATNRPQDLDEAARRRFSKRIYVPLPGIAARRRLIMQLLRNEDHQLTENDFDIVAQLTEGYSCHDISSVCKDAAMAPLRECGCDIVGVERERLRPFNLSDFKNSLRKIRPSVAPEECKAYEEWNQKFGNSSF
jgi:SpoVK/Ycf46/Vps4 family AAA+-type ATPase